MKKSLPKYVEWQVTAKCNLNCIHCSSVRRDSRNDLSTVAATALVHELLDEQVRSVTLSGGEPLLRDDWELLCSILKENDVSVQIISNGQYLGESEARRIGQLGVNFVWLGLDGPEQAHNTIRQHPKAFDRVINAAAMLEKMQVPYGFITTLLATNYDQLPELCEVIHSANAALWQIWLGKKTNDAPIWLSSSQIRKIVIQLPELRKNMPQLIIGDNIGYDKSMTPLRTPAFIDDCAATRFTGCYGAKTIMGIQNDGSLKGCLSMPDMGAASPAVLNSSLRTKFYYAASQHQALKKKALAACGNCGHLSECNGGCPAFALANTVAPEPRYCHWSVSAHPDVRAVPVPASQNNNKSSWVDQR